MIDQGRLDALRQSPRQADVTDVEDLCDEVVRLNREVEISQRNAADNGKALQQVMADRKALREVLKFYATQMGESNSKDRRIIEQDGGRRARAALGLPP